MSSEVPRCSEICTFLASTPRASAAKEYGAACADGGSTLAADFDCEQLQYELNCIYAASGLEVRDKEWEEVFREPAWPARDAMKNLGDVAKENVAQLERLGRECQRTLAIEKRAAETWAKNVLDGKPNVPAVNFDCRSEEACVPMSRRAMRKTLLGIRSYSIGAEQQPSRTAASAEAQRAFRGTKLAAFHVWFSSNCADEGCAASYRLVFDARHDVVALEIMPVAACPFVYSLADEPVLEGEILRNLDHPSLEQDNALSISTRQCGGVARFRIAEEKDEVTSLDSVLLLVDGVEVRPDACIAGNAPYCTNDGRALSLARGEHLDVAFAIPPGAECNSFVLLANGHYTRTLRRRRVDQPPDHPRWTAR